MKSHFILTSLMTLSILSHLTYAADFKLTSPSFKSGGSISMDQVFNGFGCSGKNISPQLEWTDPPEGTKSFALTVYDPDAPTGSGWWHWVVFNLPASTRKLDLNAGQPQSKKFPKGAVQSRTDFGKTGYGGPCPPEGDKPHRYFFKVYALKDTLPLKEDTPAAQVGFYINQNKLAEAELMGTFKR